MQLALTNYHIKLLAATLMVVDHVGVIFFPDLYILRAFGRLSFPLFAWLLVQGEAHTRNVWRYGIRLLVLGVISQPIYQLTFDSENINILFTLLTGLICLRAARLVPQYQLFVWIGLGVLAELAHIEYGLYGIAIIAFIWKFRPDEFWWSFWILLHLLLVFAEPSFGAFQLPAVLTPLLFHFTTHELGAKARWFYLFYPGHLLILYLLNQWI